MAHVTTSLKLNSKFFNKENLPIDENFDYFTMLKRMKNFLKTKQKFSVGGLYLIPEKNANEIKSLLVKSYSSIGKLKLPGGIIESIHDVPDFLGILESYLKENNFRPSLQKEIIDYEYKNNLPKGKRNVIEREFILKMIENTGYYPTSFSFGFDVMRSSHVDKTFNNWQIFYNIWKMASPNSVSVKYPIQQASKITNLESTEKDLFNSRKQVQISRLIEKIGPFSHKVASINLLHTRANYLSQKKQYEMSRKLADAYYPYIEMP